MTQQQRRIGRIFREMVRLDRAWKAEGKAEGRTENRMCWRMGQLARAGVPAAKVARARKANG